MINEEEEEEIRARRNNDTETTLKKNYAKTFIEPIENAANRRYKNSGISKIELVPLLNLISQINIYDENGNKIKNSEIENAIKKFWVSKKNANDKNSDRYFKERKPTNQKENLFNRSLGENIIFNY